MKTFLIVIALFSTVIYFIIDEDKLWLLLYGSSAEEYASSLLEKQQVEVPDEFIDYTINVKQEYVILFRHDSDVFFGYFPLQLPTSYENDFNGLEWEPLSDKWFVVTFD